MDEICQWGIRLQEDNCLDMTPISVARDTLRINNLTISDPEIIRFFESVPEEQRGDRLERAIKLGVVALQSVDLSERVDYVHKSFDGLSNDFCRKMEDTFGERGRAQQLIENYLGEKGLLAEEMKRTFGDDGQFSKIIESHFGKDGTFLKELFNPSNPDTPLGTLKKNLEDQFIQLRTDLALDVQRKDLVKHTNIKGREFEDEFDELIRPIARPFSDTVEKTGDTPGLLGKSKKGDFVVGIAHRKDLNIVFEVKDRGNVSLHEIRREMDEAMKNRNACYGIFVSKSVECLPAECGWFNEYDGKYVVISLSDGEDYPLQKEMLEVGYRWARLKALSTGTKDTEQANMATIIQALESAKRSLSTFSKMKGSCTSGHKAIQTIENDIEAFENDLKSQFFRIETELRR